MPKKKQEPTKTLYLLVRNGGDGSNSIHYTFNEKWIQKKEDGEFDEDYWDGDGFHYDTLEVPMSCTLESLGISDCADDDEEDEEE